MNKNISNFPRSNHLPMPLTPGDCDLRDFTFMPLDVLRLRDSDISAIVSGDEFRAAVLLWCASWHQIPAASIPDDDVVLAQLAGYGRVVREWSKLRAGALHGWIKCADGRLYHPIVAEKANEAWQAKRAQRWKTECARIKKHNQRHGQDLPFPTLEAFLADDGAPLSRACPPGPAFQETETGTETGKSLPARAQAADDAAPPPMSRIGELCRRLRQLGIAAAPGLFAKPGWAPVLQRLDDEFIVAVVAQKLRAHPGEHFSAAYFLPVLSDLVRNPGKPAQPSFGGTHAERQRVLDQLTGRHGGGGEQHTIDGQARLVG